MYCKFGEGIMNLISLTACIGLFGIAIYMIVHFIIFDYRKMSKSERYLYISVIINLVLSFILVLTITISSGVHI